MTPPANAGSSSASPCSASPRSTARASRSSLFLQNLRLTFGSGVVLEGVLLGALFTAAVGVMTFVLHAKLPYKKLLIITGVLLLAVLIVMVGEEVNEMQLAGWIGTTSMGFTLPGWLGEWLSIFPNWETVIGQVLAVGIVLGSYFGAQYFRVWRPRQRGEREAHMAEAAPTQVPVQAPTATPIGV